MKKSKLMVLLLATAMIFVLPLTGCGKQSESEEPADAAVLAGTGVDAFAVYCSICPG